MHATAVASSSLSAAFESCNVRRSIATNCLGPQHFFVLLSIPLVGDIVDSSQNRLDGEEWPGGSRFVTCSQQHGADHAHHLAVKQLVTLLLYKAQTVRIGP